MIGVNVGRLFNPASIHSSAAANTLLTGLVSYWKADENTGTTVGDSKGSNTLTWTSANWITGKINAGLNFTGANNVSNNTVSTGFSGNQPFSVALWINPSAANASNAMFDYGTSATSGARLGFIYTSTYVLRSSHWSDDNTFTTTLDQNSWNRVVLTYDGTTEKLYKNGTFKESWTPTALNLASAQPLLLGKSIDGNFLGAAVEDEIGLWSVALSQANITADWNGGAGLPFSSFH